MFGHADHTQFRGRRRTSCRAAALAAALPAGARLVLSMGCHSGLAVSDATVGGGAAANDLAVGVDGARRGLRRHHRIRLRRSGQRRLAGTLDDAVRRATRRRGVVGRRVAQRQAAVLRQPRSVRRLRREGALQHHPVRPADVRRRHRSDPSDRHLRTRRRPPCRARLVCRRPTTTRTSPSPTTPAPSAGGSRPAPATGRNCRRSLPAGRSSLVPSST